jgi:hypothetical protein
MTQPCSPMKSSGPWTEPCGSQAIPHCLGLRFLHSRFRRRQHRLLNAAAYGGREGSPSWWRKLGRDALPRRKLEMPRETEQEFYNWHGGKYIRRTSFIPPDWCAWQHNRQYTQGDHVTGSSPSRGMVQQCRRRQRPAWSWSTRRCQQEIA